MVFYVTVVNFRMTPFLSKLTSTLMDDWKFDESTPSIDVKFGIFCILTIL